MHGNPIDRGTLGFQVEFEDGTMVEKTFNDIKRTVALNNFIRNNKELLPLTAETLKAQAQLKKQIKQGNILEKYRNAKEVYIDVRWSGSIKAPSPLSSNNRLIAWPLLFPWFPLQCSYLTLILSGKFPRSKAS